MKDCKFSCLRKGSRKQKRENERKRVPRIPFTFDVFMTSFLEKKTGEIPTTIIRRIR